MGYFSYSFKPEHKRKWVSPDKRRKSLSHKKDLDISTEHDKIAFLISYVKQQKDYDIAKSV